MFEWSLAESFAKKSPKISLKAQSIRQGTLISHREDSQVATRDVFTEASRRKSVSKKCGAFNFTFFNTAAVNMLVQEGQWVNPPIEQCV